MVLYEYGPWLIDIPKHHARAPPTSALSARAPDSGVLAVLTVVEARRVGGALPDVGLRTRAVHLDQ